MKKEDLTVAPYIEFELDENIPRLSGEVVTTTGVTMIGEHLIKIKDQNGWYKFLDENLEPTPDDIPETIVKIGEVWYVVDPDHFCIA
jgi:hypothetical protein